MYKKLLSSLLLAFVLFFFFSEGVDAACKLKCLPGASCTPRNSSGNCPENKAGICYYSGTPSVTGCCEYTQVCDTCSPSSSSCCSPAQCGAGYTTTNTGCTPITRTCSNTGICTNALCSAAGYPTSRTCYPLDPGCTPPTPTCKEGYVATKPTGATCQKTFTTECTTDCGNKKTENIVCYKSDACTPTTPDGYQDTIPGPLCNTPTTRSCTTDCGNTKTKDVYPVETNTTKPATPTSITIGIDSWTSPNLSTSSDSRTLIRYPFQTSTTLTRIPTISPPPITSRGIGAKITVNGTEHKTSIGAFSVNNQPASITLNQGAIGTIIAKNYTLNKCDDNVLDSDPRTGYYKVNNLPEGIVAGIVADPDKNSENRYGCTPASNHTGRDANNILTVTVQGEDQQGGDTINGAIIWLIKNKPENTDSAIETAIALNTETTLTSTSSPQRETDPERIGIFVTKDGYVYTSQNPNKTFTGWRRASTNKNVFGKDEEEIIEEVKLISATTPINGDQNRAEFKIDLKFPENSPIDGTYTLWTGMTDTLSYLKIGAIETIDHRSTKKIPEQTWTFDFFNPVVSNLNVASYNQEGLERQLINLTWNSDDSNNPNNSGSGIPRNHTVVNVAKLKESKSISLEGGIPEERITPYSSLVPAQIGLLGDSIVSGWIHPKEGNGGRSIDINIGENDKGTFVFYITAYDNACNRSQIDKESVDLNKWIATKGGLFYSKGAISFSIKNIDGNDDNLGTELIFTHDNQETFFGSINDIRTFPEEKKNPAIAKNIRNRINERTLYNKLTSNLKERMEWGELGEIKAHSLDNIICEDPDGCYLRLEDQTLPNNIIYSGKIVIYSEGDIRMGDKIEPTEPNEDVMYIFSEGNITMRGEQNSTSISLAVDSIDAFLVAKGKITIERGTQNDLDAQDQVRVTGGIAAFGLSPDLSTAISLQRSLGTLNLTKPSLIVDYHPKYSVESKRFFGSWYRIYKSELGLKPG